MVNQFRTGPPPGPRPEGIHQVLVVPAGNEALCVQLLSKEILGLYCHYLHDQGPERRNVPCLRRNCPWDQTYRRIWKGYVPVVHFQKRTRHVLELPMNAARHVYRLLLELHCLSCTVWQFSRKNPLVKTSTLNLKTTSIGHTYALPESFEVLPSVLHMWGVECAEDDLYQDLKDATDYQGKEGGK